MTPFESLEAFLRFSFCFFFLLIPHLPPSLPDPSLCPPFSGSLSLSLSLSSPIFLGLFPPLCPPLPGSLGHCTYLKTLVGGRATPEAVPTPQGTSSRSSSSSCTRELLDTWRVSITCGETGKGSVRPMSWPRTPDPRVHPPLVALRAPYRAVGSCCEAGSPLISLPQPPQRAVTQTRGLGARGQLPPRLIRSRQQ